MNKILSIILFVVIILSGEHSYSGAITDSEFSATTLAPLNDITASSKGSVPVGTVIVWPVASDPEDMTNSDGTHNWLECDGQAFNTTTYSALSGIVGTKTPNYQGMFLRGNGSQDYAQNNGSTIGVTNTTYTSSSLGQVQGDATRNITGSLSNLNFGCYPHGADQISGSLEIKIISYRNNIQNDVGSGVGNSLLTINYNSKNTVPTASENRPVNMAVRYLIRALP